MSTPAYTLAWNECIEAVLEVLRPVDPECACALHSVLRDYEAEVIALKRTDPCATAPSSGEEGRTASSE